MIRTVISETPVPPNLQIPSVHQSVYYRRGALRRKDDLGDKGVPTFSSFANCDTKTGFLIDLAAREYRTYKVVRSWSAEEKDHYLQKNPENAVQVESRTVDTGERKTYFGHAARHLVTTIRVPASKSGLGGEETIDGWYTDHESSDHNCTPESLRNDPSVIISTVLVNYPDFPVFHHTGPLPNGLAVKQTRSSTTPNGKDKRIIKLELTMEELSDSDLSPSMFELPSGLRENQQLLRGK